jgi:hypothetical protein
MSVASFIPSRIQVVGTISGAHAGTMHFDGGVYTYALLFDPDVDFAAQETVTVTLSGQVQSTDGATLGTDYVFAFQTVGNPTVIGVGGTMTTDTQWQSGNVYLITNNFTFRRGGR